MTCTNWATKHVPAIWETWKKFPFPSRENIPHVHLLKCSKDSGTKNSSRNPETLQYFFKLKNSMFYHSPSLQNPYILQTYTQSGHNTGNKKKRYNKFWIITWFLLHVTLPDTSIGNLYLHVSILIHTHWKPNAIPALWRHLHGRILAWITALKSSFCHYFWQNSLVKIFLQVSNCHDVGTPPGRMYFESGIF